MATLEQLTEVVYGNSDDGPSVVNNIAIITKLLVRHDETLGNQDNLIDMLMTKVHDLEERVSFLDRKYK